MTTKAQDKHDKMSEIDEGISKIFDIKKVNLCCGLNIFPYNYLLYINF